MKFTATDAFDFDFARLSRHQRHGLIAAIRQGIPATAGAHSADAQWPASLNFRLRSVHVYSITWSPDSRYAHATFHFEKDDEGDTVLVWRRIGDHSIYKDP